MDRMLLKENRWMDDVLFPVNVHRFTCTPDDNIFTCHWHDELEFLRIREGSALIQVGTEFVPLSAGEAVLVHGGELHAGHVPPDSAGFSFSAVVFHDSLLYGNRLDAVQTRLLDPLLKSRMPAFLVITPGSGWSDRALADLAELDALLVDRPPAYEIGVKALLFDLFYRILPQLAGRGERTVAQSQHAERMKAVLTHIRDHHARPLTINELAALAGFSPGHFCTFFRRMTGTTFTDYLNRYRVNRAAELLRASDRKILDVAMEVGFDNASYFISRFRKYMRCTPQAYRRQGGGVEQTDPVEPGASLS